MNALNIMLRGASVLVLACVVSAVPQGYGAGGDGGLGVDLGGAGGHGSSGVGGGSVLPFVFVGKGVLPESAIGGVSGGVDGGVIGGEYSAPDAAGGFDAGVAGGFGGGVAGGFGSGVDGGFDAGSAGGFDTGVAGGFDTGVAGGFDTGFDDGVSHVSPPVSVYDAPH
ncbi:glycine-rich cell wall structural protein-like [Penaeus monodon]|uniref:glycine-rich cell wall structural protein-like n=1 Tax=Penaeus monodon TaxID=6687 RepID=UPI0018A72E27|nr:glycine-rich cell wall structural protein-like [Penaeus monodon]